MRKIDPVIRLQQNIVVDDDGCWMWQLGKTKDGYGKIKVYGETLYAHRFSYESFVGAIPEGFDVNHKCHSDVALSCGSDTCKHRGCVNPEHLEALSRDEHGSKSLHAQRTTCIHGHNLDYLLPEGNGTKRGCRTCNGIAVAKYQARKKLIEP